MPLDCSEMIKELIKAAEDYVKSHLKNVDCSHDWNHIERVRRNALQILESEQAEGRYIDADIDVIELSALLHDIGDFKYTKDHLAGPRMVKEFLGQNMDMGLTEEQVEKVSQVVGNISFRHELSHSDSNMSKLPKEIAIVQDADRLDAVGAVGIARCFAFSGAMKRPFYTEADRQIKSEITAEEYNKQAEKGGGSAIGHFYEKLFKLKDMMKTETGRKIAIERNEFMKTFISTIRSECGL